MDYGWVGFEEGVYIFVETAGDSITAVGCDIAPRLSYLDAWLTNHTGVTDLKIIGHSEGAATVGTYIANWLDGRIRNTPGFEGEKYWTLVSQAASDLLNSQLRGVFLVDCPTGISDIGLANYDSNRLNDVGWKLSREKGIKSGDIYNACSIVHSVPLSGWNSYNVASWNDYALAGIFGIIINTPRNHTSAKKDSLTVIKSILEN